MHDVRNTSKTYANDHEKIIQNDVAASVLRFGGLRGASEKGNTNIFMAMY